MSRKDEIESTRRGLLRAGAAGILGAVGIGTAAGRRSTAAEQSDDYELRPMEPADVTPADTETVQPVPEPAAGIQPGSVLVTDNGAETAGFIWREVRDEESKKQNPDEKPDLYVSTDGLLLLEEGNASANAARDGEEGEDLSDLTVEIDLDGTFGDHGSQAGGLTTVELGEVVYARQATIISDPAFGSVFGLVKVPDDMRDMVDPSVPQFGGPTGVSPGALPLGDPVHMYGNGLQGTTFVSKGMTGASIGTVGGSWAAVMPEYATTYYTEGGVAAGMATHHVGRAQGDQFAAIGAGGTNMAKCKQLVEDDLGLEIELVKPGDL